ncbi:MAG: hypothetical protein ACRELD_10045 [Longimicrobiales bacterium]
MAPRPLSMAADEMRRLGELVLDHAARRFTGLDAKPAWQGATRAELEARLGGPAPELPGDPEALLRQLIDDVLPYASRVDHPRFLAYVPGSPTVIRTNTLPRACEERSSEQE